MARRRIVCVGVCVCEGGPSSSVPVSAIDRLAQAVGGAAAKEAPSVGGATRRHVELHAAPLPRPLTPGKRAASWAVVVRAGK